MQRVYVGRLELRCPLQEHALGRALGSTIQTLGEARCADLSDSDLILREKYMSAVEPSSDEIVLAANTLRLWLQQELVDCGGRRSCSL